MRTDGFKSLWGQGNADTVVVAQDPGRINKARDAFCMPGEREQRIYTPEWILEKVREVFGGEIDYDPAGCPENRTKAKRSTFTRGLIDRWPGHTFCNPPWGKSLFDPENEMEPYLEELRIRQAWKDAGKKGQPKFPPGLPLKKAGLKDWLAMQDTCRGTSVMLVPLRSQRSWLRTWWHQQNVVIGLDGVKFGEAEAHYPGPVVISLRHKHKDGPDRFAFNDMFVRLFSGHGDPLYIRR
jgi:hypothetical protein